MALINCKKCGETISDKATECPHCGANLTEQEDMESEVIKCEECGFELHGNTDECPNCGCPIEPKSNSKKKKIYIPVLVIIITIAIVVAGIACGNVDEEETTEEPKQTTEKLEEEKDITKASNAEKYQYISKNNSQELQFSMSEDAIKFIDKHPDFFPGSNKNRGAMTDYINYEISYNHIDKNPSKYSNKLIGITGYVTDCKEFDEDMDYTYLQVVDYDGNNYCMYYLGKSKDILADMSVEVFMLPFDMVSFENMGGTYTKAVMGACCYVSELYD